ncbi:helix-turn-helix domain-containing protein [Actinomadura miaoliensis]
MHLSKDERQKLIALAGGKDAADSVVDRVHMVLWRGQGRPVSEIAAALGTTPATVYRWLARYEQSGINGLTGSRSTGRPRSVPEPVRSRIIALTRSSPPAESGLSHWSSRAMARYLKCEGIEVSHNFIAELWRDHGLKLHRQGEF